MPCARRIGPTPLLIRRGDVYAPEPLGVRDVLCAGGRIVGLSNDLEPPGGVDVQVIDAGGQKVVPGLIDGHIHIAGAGGEGGPATRTPEMPLSWMIQAGITTVVGLLGTDGVTRSLDSLLMKAKGLRAEGVSAWMWTGSYQLPPPTLTGDVARDIAIIEEVIGVGEIAIADHRSSNPTALDLVRLAKEARRGGMLGGKCGLVHLHLGDAEDPFSVVQEAVRSSELGFAQFYPTHINRNPHCFDQAKQYGIEAPVDITACGWRGLGADDVKPSRALRELLEAGVPNAHITMSSDACGSLPEFDAHGELVGLTSGKPGEIWREIVDAVRNEGLELSQALDAVTANPAAILRLPGKGSLTVGADADLLLIDSELDVQAVVAGGELFMQHGALLRQGTFE